MQKSIWSRLFAFAGGMVVGHSLLFPLNSSAEPSPWPMFLPAIVNGGSAAEIETAAGQIWMDRNLGASRVAISMTDAEAYGDLYQWGRLADGHQDRTSPTASTLSATDLPGHGSFILAPSSPWDWRSSQNDNLWQGIAGINNPCPAGFRLPTHVELDAERLSWDSNDSAGAFASPLKLVSAGYRSPGIGVLRFTGRAGYYWSSTVNGTLGRYLFFGSGFARVGSTSRAVGASVRCLKD